MGKRIAVFADGTWNTPTQAHPTNVIRLKNVTLEKGDDNIEQKSFYDEGVGATGTWWEKLLGGTSGLGLDENILDCYKFLVENHEPDDQIFLFGFSRGAYTVRSLAGLIRNCGLLHKENIHLAEEAMDLYRNRSQDAHPNSSAALSFKKQFSKTTDIWFLGVWDTVGALGIPSRYIGRLFNRRYRFHDMKLSGSVKHAYHALSVDEKRGAFAPSVWTTASTANRDFEQVWFAGDHSEVGGGSSDAGLPDVAFMWMMYKAQACGLEFDQVTIGNDISPSPFGRSDADVKGIYKFLTRYTRRVGKADYANQAVHPAAVSRFEGNNPVYTPSNLKKYLESSDRREAETGPFPKRE